MKTKQQIIKIYSHDYRHLKLSQTHLKELLEDFLEEIEDIKEPKPQSTLLTYTYFPGLGGSLAKLTVRPKEDKSITKGMKKYLDNYINNYDGEEFMKGYRQGVKDEIECVETSGEHLDLQKKLKSTPTPPVKRVLNENRSTGKTGCKNCEGKGFVYTSGNCEPCVVCNSTPTQSFDNKLPEIKKLLIVTRGTELLNYKKLDLAKKINEIITYLEDIKK